MAKGKPSFVEAACALVEGTGNHDLLDKALRHCSAQGPSLQEFLAYLGTAALKFSLVWTHVRWNDRRDSGRITSIWSAFSSVKGTLAGPVADEAAKAVQYGKGVQELSAPVRRDALTALLGAAYLANFDAAHELAVRQFYGDFAGAASSGPVNYKTILQDWAQKRKAQPPQYTVLREEGPDHDKKFVVQAVVGGTSSNGVGAGKTKKEAETAAAGHLLVQLGVVSSSPSGRNPAANDAAQAIDRLWSLDKWLSGVDRARAGLERVPPFVKQLKQETGIEIDARLADVATGHASTRPPGRGKLFGAVETGLEILGNTAFTLALVQGAAAHVGLGNLESKAANGTLVMLHSRLNDNAFKREFGRRWLPAFRTGTGFKGAMSDQVLSDLFEGVVGALVVPSLDNVGRVERFVSGLLREQVDYGTMTVRAAGQFAKKDSVTVLHQLLQLLPTGAESLALPSRFKFSKTGADHKANFRYYIPVGKSNAFIGQGETKAMAFAESADLLLKAMAPRLTDRSLPPIGVAWADDCINRLRHEIYDKRNRSLITRLVGYKKLRSFNPELSGLLASSPAPGKPASAPTPARSVQVERAPARRPAVEKPKPEEAEPVYEFEVELAEIAVAGLLSELSTADGFNVAFLGFSGPGAGFALAADTPCVHCHAPTLVTLLKLLSHSGGKQPSSRSSQVSARIHQGELELIVTGSSPEPGDDEWKRAGALADSISAQLIRRSAGELVLNLPLVLDSIDHFAPSDLDELL